ncbi:MAG TPA: hypothetical protein VMW77_04625 [Methanoregula sp.]|nr:hypothetical protein [Methanoregula sp.]
MKLIHANKKSDVPEYHRLVAGRMPTGSLRRAIRNYFRDDPIPARIAESLVPCERHSVDEERPPEVYAIRAKRRETEPGQDSKGGKNHGEPGHPFLRVLSWI